MHGNRKDKALDAILQQGLLPLFFHPDPEVSLQVLRALYRAGIGTVEYTNRGAAALPNYRALLQVRDTEMPGLLLGIGTIKSAADAAAYIAAGADYLISPGTLPEVGEAARAAGLLWVPGCMTPTEILTAESGGCSLVKLFPGNLLGPSFVTAIRDIFPAMQFMPTGGVEVSEDNLRAWFGAGVSAVGMGSRLISQQMLEAKDYESIENGAAAALRLVRKVRQ